MAPTCGDQPSGEVAAGTWMTGAVGAKSDAWMVCLLGFKFFKLHLFPWFVSLTSCMVRFVDFGNPRSLSAEASCSIRPVALSMRQVIA